MTKTDRRVRGNFEVRAISFGSAFAVIALVLVFAPHWLSGIPRIVAAYDVSATVLLALLWILAMHARPDDTRNRAAQEDPGRNAVFFTVIIAGLVGIASAVSILGRGPHAPTKTESEIDMALAIIAVIAGWIMINTTYTFRYAHLYYYDSNDDEQSDGGLKFPGTETPSDFDFAYFSFVIGMTYQVSDVQIESPKLRRLVLGHGLISFCYNTAIIALVVNIASSLLHG